VNLTETSVLTTIIGDVKQMKFSREQVESWQLILADTDFTDARAVVVEYLREHPGEWMEAGHIVQGVKEIREARRRAYGSLIPEQVWPELDNEPFGELHMRRTRELAELVASGKIERGAGGRPELTA
jgi:hypothetical protein